MDSLALKFQQGHGRNPHSHEVFCFRSRKGDLIKVLWHDGVGMSLYLKRLEAWKFIWPASENRAAMLVSAAQLGYLLEGIDWRNPRWAQRPASAGWGKLSLCFIGLFCLSVVSFCHVGVPFRNRCFARRPCRSRRVGHCRRARIDAVPCRNLGI